MEFESCILGEIEEVLTPEERKMIEEIIETELSKSRRALNCALQDIERSKSLGELTYNLNKFSDMYFLTLRKITDEIWTWRNLWRRLRPRRISRIDFMYYISAKLEKFVIPMLSEAIEKAKSIGQNLGIESITVSISVGISGPSIQMSFTTKI